MAEQRNVWSSAWAGSDTLRGREKPASPELCAGWADSMQKLEEYVVWLEDCWIEKLGGGSPELLRDVARSEGIKTP